MFVSLPIRLGILSCNVPNYLKQWRVIRKGKEGHVARFVISDVVLNIAPRHLSVELQQRLEKGRYETQEAATIRKLLKTTDTVLELGTGIGFTAIIAARVVGGESVVTVEANPALLPDIKANFQENGIEGVTLINRAVLPESGRERAQIFVPEAFWGATIDGLNQPLAEEITVPAIGFDEVLAAHPSTVLICDVEGAEVAFFKRPIPESFALILLEMHPNHYNILAVKTIFDRLSAQGFGYVPYGSRGPVVAFRRVASPNSA